MKKTVAILILALTSLNLSAQAVERNTLMEFKINLNDFKVIQKIEGQDTTIYGYIYYQNARYTSISDTELVMLDRKRTNELIEGFNFLIPKEKTKEITYKLSFGDLINTKYGIYFYSEDNKYTGFSRKKLVKGLTQLEKLKELID